jgi:uncharacterized membrane protein YeaQ/YmgE (transglycosylase-associated protein family)
METLKHFSIKRASLLIQRHILYNLKTYMISFAAVGGILIFISLMNTWSNGGHFSETVFHNLGQVFAFIGGALVTSNIYKEISSKHRGWFYMMLPANPSEKLLSYWLLTSVGYAIAASVALSVASLVTSLFTTMFFKTTFYVFNPLASQHLTLMLHYCIVQSVFFLGAVYFEKNNFLKTILSVFVLQMVLGIVGGIVGKILFGEWHIEANTLSLEGDYFFTVLIPNVAKTFYYGLMIPLFLTVSYFRLKEREV